MTEARPYCPSCQSISVVKNGAHIGIWMKALLQQKATLCRRNGLSQIV